MPTLAQIWEERGRQQGLQKGLQQGHQEGEAVRARADVLAILEARFGTVPESLAQYIEALNNLSNLRELPKTAATADSLDAFREQVSH